VRSTQEGGRIVVGWLKVPAQKLPLEETAVSACHQHRHHLRRLGGDENKRSKGAALREAESNWEGVRS
jgi:hypothetical protein